MMVRLYLRRSLYELNCISYSFNRSSTKFFVNVVRFNSGKAVASATSDTIEIENVSYPRDSWTNVGTAVLNCVPRKLLQNPSHPLATIKNIIESNFPRDEYTAYTNISPVVTTKENFDSLCFPEDHPGRSKTDTYYVNESLVLRTHTSAHQCQMFKSCPTPGYLISADVYRRDEIDKSHYPVFHQMEGARTWCTTGKSTEELVKEINICTEKIPSSDLEIVEHGVSFGENNPKQPVHADEVCIAVGNHLKKSLELVIADIFKRAQESSGNRQKLRVRWIDTYFPFTSPSWEMEIFWQGDWLEVFGCGVVEQGVFNNAGMPERVGWAFGLGLERLAMVLFGVPDIRLFWSTDDRFISQFSPGKVSLFTPYSKYPGTSRDTSFWVGQKDLHENDLMEIVRGHAGDLVESVKLVDHFVHPKTGKQSLCYRINYQSMERSLTNDEINNFNDNIRQELVEKFDVKLR
ncbi:phenylalanyl-tRNA synthetase [Dipodascopsis uninucleata]